MGNQYLVSGGLGFSPFLAKSTGALYSCIASILDEAIFMGADGGLFRDSVIGFCSYLRKSTVSVVRDGERFVHRTQIEYAGQKDGGTKRYPIRSNVSDLTGYTAFYRIPHRSDRVGP